jgi:SprT-like family
LLIDPLQQCDAINQAADEVATLLHECIHAYMKINGNTEKNEMHGPVFMACVNECVNLLESTKFFLPGPTSLQGQGVIPLHPRFQNLVITRQLVVGGMRNIGWSA